jgi:hypothetical protein
MLREILTRRQSLITASDMWSNPAFHHCLLWLGALLCFVPAMVGPRSPVTEDTPLGEALASAYSLFRDTSVAQLTLAAPILLDFLLDCLTHKTPLKARSNDASSRPHALDDADDINPVILGNRSKLTLLVGFILVPVVSFIVSSVDSGDYASPDPGHLALIYVCSRKASEIIVFCEFCYCLRSINGKFWPWSTTSLSVLSFITGGVLSVFSLSGVCIGVSSEAHPASTAPFVISALMMYIPVLVMACCSFRWMYLVALKRAGRLASAWWAERRRMRNKYQYQDEFERMCGRSEAQSNPTAGKQQQQRQIHGDGNKIHRKEEKAGNGNGESRDTDLVVFQTVFVTAIILISLVVVAVTAAYWDVYQLSDTGLLAYNVTMILAELMVLLFSARHSRLSTVDTLVSTALYIIEPTIHRH